MPRTPIDPRKREELAARAFLGEKQSCLADEAGLSQQAISQALSTRRAAFQMIWNAAITSVSVPPKTPRKE